MFCELYCFYREKDRGVFNPHKHGTRNASLDNQHFFQRKYITQYVSLEYGKKLQTGQEVNITRFFPYKVNCTLLRICYFVVPPLSNMYPLHHAGV